VAVGKHVDELVRECDLLDPLLPIKKFLKRNPYVLTIGQGFDFVTSIHLAEQLKTSSKFTRDRALTVSSGGQVWTDIAAFGCSRGFEKLRAHISKEDFAESRIGLAKSHVYRMKRLIEVATSMLEDRRLALACDHVNCLSCIRAA
jgi:aminoglycoside N3'-acetyltransferase